MRIKREVWIKLGELIGLKARQMNNVGLRRTVTPEEAIVSLEKRRKHFQEIVDKLAEGIEMMEKIVAERAATACE